METLTLTSDPQVQFASLMETLGSEALGKILNIVEEAELQGEENRSETSFIHILNHVGTYPPSIKHNQ